VEDEVEGHAALMGKKRNAYTPLVGKPEGKRSYAAPWRVQKYIKIDLKRNLGWRLRSGLN
jgi:hypothetical protein